MAGTPPFDPINRVVQREGKRVEIVHHIGGYTSKPTVYVLPSPAKAVVFEAHAREYVNGIPITISLDWAKYRLEEPEEPTPPKEPDT